MLSLLSVSRLLTSPSPRLQTVRLALGSLALLTGLSFLGGCGSNFSASAPAAASSGAAISGHVFGGQQPLTGARVYLFAAGTTGYASAARSLLNPLLPGVSTDASGNGYVVTGSGGNFSVTGDFLCQSANDQVYVLVRGGNPGLAAGTDNSAIAMMDALGTCSSINPATFVVVNELSTVAAVEALQQFMTDSTHVGASSTNATGIANAFTTATMMVPIAGPVASSTTPGGNGTIPVATLHTLANILAACVNTASAASSQCTSLFTNAQPTGGPAPSDVTMAALDIALNPTHNVSALYNLSTPTTAFQPTLASAPADWTIGINYTLGGGQPLPGYLAIDGSNNVWIASLGSEKQNGTDAIIKLSPFGALLSGSTGFTNNGNVNLPEGLAIDDIGNVWVANTPTSVLKMTNDGSAFPGFPVNAQNYPQGIALDTNGDAWVSNSGLGSGQYVDKISSTGSLLIYPGVKSSGFAGPQGVAVDANNSVWVAGQSSNSLLKFTDAGVLQSGSGAGFTGGGLSAPTGVAIGAANRVWVLDPPSNSPSSAVSLFSNTGTPISPSSGYVTTALGFENLIVVDGLGTAWTASCGPQCVGFGTFDNVVHLAQDGTLLSGTNGFRTPGLNGPQGVGIDNSGNLWVGNSAGVGNSTPGTVTELVGVAAPVRTPIQAAVKANLLGQRP